MINDKPLTISEVSKIISVVLVQNIGNYWFWHRIGLVALISIFAGLIEYP